MRLIYILFTFTLMCTSAFAEQDGIPEEMLLNEPSCIINHSVNIITGHYQENEIDLEVAGPHPLFFQRSYVSGYSFGEIGRHWATNHNGEVHGDHVIQNISEAIVRSDFGTYTRYKGKVPKNKQEMTSHVIETRLLNKYLTNCPDFCSLAGSHIRNNLLLYKKHHPEAFFYTGNGFLRHYKSEKNDSKNYLMDYERQPNGCFLRYTEGNIIYINLENGTGDYLCSLAVDKTNKSCVVVNGSDGKWVKYHVAKVNPYYRGFYLTTIEGNCIPSQAYEYTDSIEGNLKIAFKHLPEGRFLNNEYYDDDSDLKYGRVKLQKAPVGTDMTPIVTHRYFYNLQEEYNEYDNTYTPLGGITTVHNAHGYQTDYFFNEDFRITDIWRWGEGNAYVYSIEQSFWGENDSKDSTNLMSRALSNGQREVKLCRSYAYDNNGNATHKFFWGNLTGKQTGNIILDKNGIPYPWSSECHIKSYTYTPGPNFQLLTENDNKKIIEYSYYPNTNLVANKLVRVEGKVKKREFKGYDKNGSLFATIVDDGSGHSLDDLSSINERHATIISNTTTAPIGLPEVVEQFYMDASGQSIFQGKVCNQYSSMGKLLFQKHYDSENVHRFTLEWDYDLMGNVIMEKDALGQKITRKYDLNKNLIFEKKHAAGSSKTLKYDFVNRLIGTVEDHADGTKLTHTYRYDFLGNMVASVDTYGNETRYVYDHQNRLIQTIFPIVMNEDMIPIQPSTKIEYDLFNNPTCITDTAGGKTIIFYTAYNKPYFKVYPDGTSETFEYYSDGNLMIATAKNGSKTIYHYDAFDRVTKKEILSADGKLIQTESCDYNAFHLLSKTDPDGSISIYEYDRAGRVIAVSKGKMRTEYQYDTLGRESKVLIFHGTGKEDYTAKIKEYDLLNRVIEERSEDASGNMLVKERYEYDALGNRKIVRKYNQAGESITTTEYNTQSQIISITDALGAKTCFNYRYDYYDPLFGQNLPCIESTDPKGIVTVTINDALGRKKSEYKKDPFGQLIQKRDFYYTALDLLGRTVDAVIVNGECKDEVVNVFKYDPCGKLTEIYEAAGTPKQKVTKFTYDSGGQKQTETKPDGKALLFKYDGLGRLKEYWPSDLSFHYVYEYDANGNPCEIVERITGTKTIKKFDEYNRLAKETLANGLVLEYIYDLAGKPIKILFPDGTGMKCTYKGLFLKEISRINAQEEKIYTHTYETYDLSGNVLESSFIGKSGKAGYDIDLNGRLIGISTDAWSASISDFDSTGNITKKTSKDKLGSYSSTYDYDGLDQLIKEDGDFSENYAFDSLYNRIRRGSLEYSVNRLNQITHDGKSDYQYDLNGNLIKIKNGGALTELTYDVLNRLVKVKKDGLQVEYAYDEMNRRLSKTVFERNEALQYIQTKSFKYFYQGLNEVGCCEDGNIIELRLLGLGKGAEISAAVAMEFGDAVYAPIHDLQGNVVCLVNAKTGNVQELYRYSAFGEENVYDGQGKVAQIAINPWRFSSKRTDSETGYVYFGRRYYDRQLGRWITPDPIGFEGGPNLYAYVMNHPFGSIDLYGLSTEEGSIATSNEKGFFDTVKDFMHSAYEGIRDGIVNICYSVVEGLARATSALCDSFSSYREERQIMFNQRMFQSAMNKSPPASHIAGSGRYAGIFFTNGINTIWEGLVAHGKILADAAKGFLIQCIHNPSNGFFHDLFRVFHSLKFDIASNMVAALHHQWNTHFEKYGKESRILQICHSEGAANVRNALMCYDPNLRKMIDVLAIAPAAYIGNELCGKAYHYVSTRDFVPWFDVRGRVNNQDSTVILQPHKNASFWDHDFQSPTYDRVIRSHIKAHLKRIGK